MVACVMASMQAPANFQHKGESNLFSSPDIAAFTNPAKCKADVLEATALIRQADDLLKGLPHDTAVKTKLKGNLMTNFVFFAMKKS